MDWLESIRRAIDSMERNLLETDSAEEIAKEVYMSSFYLQKGFRLITGYSMAGYVRSRRLYLAALDVLAGREKIIDIAYKYGYDTPESFTKAFSRFHGATPTQVRSNVRRIKVFLPLKISISIQGGNEMDYVVEKMKSFQVIGFERYISFETSYQEIPRFWREAFQKTKGNICVGEYGICINDGKEKGMFRYLIAGAYTGGEVPEGMVLYEVPELEWAKFSCKGPMPGALQTVNTKIFREWLPGNPEYEVATEINVEWYAEGNTADADYESAVWIPVKKK